MQLVQLRDASEKLESVGITVVGISYDPVDVLQEFSDKERIPFWLLSDEGSKTIRDYKLLHKDELPHPGTMLIDQQGVIRAKLFEQGYAKRHSVEELVMAVNRLEGRGDEK